MKRFGLLAVFGAAIVLLGPPAAKAQTLDGVDVGYCYNSSLGSSVGLSSFTDSIGAPCNGKSATAINTYRYILLCAYVANVNILPNSGVPTSAVGTGGQQLAAGSCTYYNGRNPAGLNFIQQSGGAIVGAWIMK